MGLWVETKKEDDYWQCQDQSWWFIIELSNGINNGIIALRKFYTGKVFNVVFPAWAENGHIQ